MFGFNVLSFIFMGAAAMAGNLIYDILYMLIIKDTDNSDNDNDDGAAV